MTLMISRSFIFCHKDSAGEANTLLKTESLNRNVELIKTINRLEHGGFQSKIPAITTAFTRQKAVAAESRIASPAETQYQQQTILVCDNIDLLEEPLLDPCLK